MRAHRRCSAHGIHHQKGPNDHHVALPGAAHARGIFNVLFLFLFYRLKLQQGKKTSSSSQWPNLHQHQIAHGSHHRVKGKA